MSAEVLEHAELGFANNDVVEVSRRLRRSDEKTWLLNNVNSLYRAHVLDHSVEFRLVSPDDGVTDMLATDQVVDEHYIDRESSMCANFRFDRAVRFLGNTEWIWHASSVAKPETVNLVADDCLSGFKVHGLPLVMQKPDTDIGAFTPITCVRALANSYIPVSTEPYFFHHDMAFHAEQAKGLEFDTMSAIQAIASYIVALEDQPVGEFDRNVARDLSIELAELFDYNTFTGKYFESYAKSPDDKILSQMLQVPIPFVGRKHKSDMKDLISSFRFQITKNGTVMRNAETLDHYERILQVIAPPKVEKS